MAWVPHQTLSFSFIYAFVKPLFPDHNKLDIMVSSEAIALKSLFSKDGDHLLFIFMFPDECCIRNIKMGGK